MTINKEGLISGSPGAIVELANRVNAEISALILTGDLESMSTAISTEVANRNTAISTAISLAISAEVVARNLYVSTEISTALSTHVG